MTQHNAWLHAGATVLVLALAVVCGLRTWEWVALVLAIVLVWLAEALNTALEFLADVVSPGPHPLIKQAKDVAAAAVLIASAGAAMVGALILGPHLLRLLG